MKSVKKVVKGFTGLIVGTSLLPALSSGVGGAAGSVANLGQTFAATGLAGHAAGIFSFKKKK